MTSPELDVDLIRAIISTGLLPAADFLWPRAPHPPTLHHYTDANGATEIIRTGIIRATHLRYLNDPTEGDHMWAVLRSVFGSEAGAEPPPKRAMPETVERLRVDILQHLDGPNNFARRYTPYVASFSEDDDQLGQWRAYGDNGRGYAVGFSYSDVVRTVVHGALETNVKIMRVEYDEAVQRKIVSETVNGAIALIQRNYSRAVDGAGRDLVWNSGMHGLVRLLTTLSAGMKHPAYAHEREWRLIADLVDPGAAITELEKDPLDRYEQLNLTPVQTRTRDGLIIPYINIDLRRVAGRQTIKSITVGPRLPDDLAIGPLRLLLRRAEQVNVTIRPSRVPYRG